MTLHDPLASCRFALKRRWTLAILLAAGIATGHAQVTIPVPQILAEAETHINARKPAEAAELLDRVLARADQGEAMPAGVDMERIRLAAATNHFQAQNLPRAAAIAEALIKSGPTRNVILSEARMLLGLSLALQQKYAEAVPVFHDAEDSTTFRDKALLYGAMSAHQAGQIDVAIATYSRLLSTSARSRDWADAALTLISLQLQQNQLAEARRGLTLLRSNLDLVDNLAGLNVLSLQLGDALSKANEPAGALTAYRTVLGKDDVLAQQVRRNRRMDTELAQLKALARGDATQLDSFRRLTARLEQSRTAVEEINKLSHYDATLLFRLGNAFQQRGGAWEAALIFEEIIARYPEAPEREQAYFGLVRAYAEAGRLDKTRDAAERFQRVYPQSQFGAQALYLAALAAGQRNDTTAQLKFLEIGTERYRDNTEMREPMLLMQANALFTMGRYAEAGAICQDYLRDFPSGKFAEEARYLSAMGMLAEGQASAAARAVEAYLTAYPKGKFVEDARYRLAATDYSRQEYDSAIERTQAWLNDYAASHPQRGEVYSLQGDAYAGLNKPVEAIESYRQALQLGLADEQLGYVLDELTRLYQAQRDYDAAVAMWDRFARERPDHPFVINAAYWIGKLRSREGRTAEALDGVAGIATRYVADPNRESIERLLIEISSMLAKPPRGRPGQPKPTPPALDELFARADELLLTADTANSATAKARALFVKSEIASFRKDPKTQKEMLDQIAAAYSADTLPPGILGKLGDHLLAKNELDLARTFYTQIVTSYPRSIFSDYGYVGLGEIALRENNGDEALRRFNEAIDIAGARFKLLDATLGQAKALLLLGRLDAAKNLFEQVASNRAWRGPATAESLFSLGEVLMKRGTPNDVAQAQAHYQRIYISYRRFVPWVAKSYLRSADAFEALGQTQEAVNTLREMLRDQRLAELPEAAAARQRLTTLEARVSATSTPGGGKS
ncbi:MAG TPA: tetratricopeptide repeat protein [Opitutaceae bacterium]